MQATLEDCLSRLGYDWVGAVSGLVLDGRDKADLAVKAAVVEPVDVFGDGYLEVVDVVSGSAVADELGLHAEVRIAR